jgi:tetratricopeptide (TPR) repeat protein
MARASTTICMTRTHLPLLLALLVMFGSTTARSQPQNPGLPALPQGTSNEQPGSQKSDFGSTHLIDPMLVDNEALADRGDYAQAEKNMLSYLSTHPDSADAHFLLGYIFYRQDKPDDSLAQYTLGAKLRKPEANDLAIVAMDYILLKDYRDADKWLTMATAWQPENVLYWYYLGRTKYNENVFEDAVDIFTKCLLLHPGDVRAEYNLGLAYSGLGRDDDAIAAYKEAIEWQQGVTQKDPQPYLDLGILMLKMEHPDQAVVYLQEAARLDSQNPRAHEQLGRTYEELHSLPEAESELAKAISLAPNIPPLHFELGRIYKKEGLVAKATEEFRVFASLSAAHSTDAVETPNPDHRQ